MPCRSSRTSTLGWTFGLPTPRRGSTPGWTRRLKKRKVGRFRSHFYKSFGEHLKNMPAFVNKEISMKVINQTLIADVDGDPFELGSLVQEIDKTSCKVMPNYAKCELLGMSKLTTDTLVADATTHFST